MLGRFIPFAACFCVWLLLANNLYSQDTSVSTEAQAAATDDAGSAEPSVDSDPASMDVEFDTEGLEDFDSESFDLAEVDPEADKALAGRFQQMMMVLAVVVIACVVLVVVIRARRKSAAG